MCVCEYVCVCEREREKKQQYTLMIIALGLIEGSFILRKELNLKNNNMADKKKI